jgi:hypothetical protein
MQDRQLANDTARQRDPEDDVPDSRFHDRQQDERCRVVRDGATGGKNEERGKRKEESGTVLIG